MGACLGGGDRGEEDEEEFSRSKVVDTYIRKQTNLIKKGKGNVKLLLLGTGDSGKSTFLKQMKILHKNGFSHMDYLHYQNVLRSNTLESMHLVLKFLESKEFKFRGDSIENKRIVEESTSYTEEVANAIFELWKDKKLKEVVRDNIYLIQIPSSYYYFFENAVRFAADNFKPSDEDILRAKMKTTGVCETKFEENGVEFVVVDVGGQRAERRKWIHCFDDVKAIIYLASLDEYNMTLQEDHSTNRMQESLELFKEITGSQWATGIAVILFLNKFDIFKEKISKFPLKDYFPEAEDMNLDNYEDAVEFIKSKYEEAYMGEVASFYKYETCAVDTGNCEKIFESVKDSVVFASLYHAGM